MTTPYGQDPWQPPAPGAQPPPWGPPPGAPGGPPPPYQQWGQQPNPWQPWGSATTWSPPRPNEPVAIAACVLGILSVLTFPIAAALVSGNRPAFVGAALLPLAAVVTGHLARRRLRAAEGSRGGNGLAITGLACGWPILAFLSLVLATQPHFGSTELHSYSDGTGSFTVPQAPRVDEPTQPEPPVQEPPTARGILTGTVRGLDDELVAGATVTVRRASRNDTSDAPACPLTATTTTGADGQWFLPLCQLGEGLGYSVEIRKGSLGASTELAYVNSGRTTTYDVHLARIS